MRDQGWANFERRHRTRGLSDGNLSAWLNQYLYNYIQQKCFYNALILVINQEEKLII